MTHHVIRENYQNLVVKNLSILYICTTIYQFYILFLVPCGRKTTDTFFYLEFF